MKTAKNKFIIGCFLFFALMQTGFANEQTQAAITLLSQGNTLAAEKLFQAEAEKGNGEACFYLSQIILFGKQQSVEAGLKLLNQSIKLGFVPAMDVLAGYYLHGDFLPPDHHKAAMYYKLAANQGYGPSQFNYGIMQKNGERTPRDLEESFVYLALAALNKADLGDMTLDAATYRDEVAKQLSPIAYQRACIKINNLTLVK